MKKIPKKEAEKQIEDFFLDIKNKTPEEIKKMKRLAMSYNIKLGEKKKLFCKKCFTPYSGKEEIRINKGIKSIKCGNCGYINRWRIKN